MGVALNGVVFNEEFYALEKATGAASVAGEDRLPGGDVCWIGRSQTHQMIGTRRVGTAIAVGTIRQPIAVVILVVAAFRFRHDGTVNSSPSWNAFAPEFIGLHQTVDSGSSFSALQTNASVVAAVTRTSIYENDESSKLIDEILN